MVNSEALDQGIVAKKMRKEPDTTEWIDVRPGFNMGEKQEVFGELKPGDTLVLKGNEELKAGTKVITRLNN